VRAEINLINKNTFADFSEENYAGTWGKKFVEGKGNPYNTLEVSDHPVGTTSAPKRLDKDDPLICPTCGGQMRVIAFITDHSAVDRIITLLKLTFHAECPLPRPKFSSRNF